MTLKRIINHNIRDIALVIGNGINRYKSNSDSNSWEQLLVQLWNKHSVFPLKDRVPDGIALTEFFDVLDLNNSDIKKQEILQTEFCDLMKFWTPAEHHFRLVSWAQENSVPILTTNFDNNFGKAGELTLGRNSNRTFVGYYPWESYYSKEKIVDPLNQFAVWHVNGLQEYSRSIRLGLTHYMGSVQRARSWIHEGDDENLFSGKNRNGWIGLDSWLHVVLNKSLIIFGLELSEAEVFLRWLLIERAKYFIRFPERRKNAWYFYKNEASQRPGKKIFLKNLFIEPVRVKSYEELYSKPWC